MDAAAKVATRTDRFYELASFVCSLRCCGAFANSVMPAKTKPSTEQRWPQLRSIGSTETLKQ